MLTLKGDKVLGEDERGRGEDGNPPTTHENKTRGDSGGDEGVTGRPKPAPPPRTHQFMAAGDSAETLA